MSRDADLLNMLQNRAYFEGLDMLAAELADESEGDN